MAAPEKSAKTKTPPPVNPELAESLGAPPPAHQPQFLFGTYVNAGEAPGLHDITVLGGAVNNVPSLAHLEGQLIDTLYFTSTGTFFKSNYPTLGWIKVTMVGAGGAGGGAGSTGSGQSSVGPGGGAGEYVEVTLLNSQLLDSATVTVGAGGVGTTGNGGAGGATSIAIDGGTVVANGGSGANGSSGSSSGNNMNGGAAGGASGGGLADLRVIGEDGWNGVRYTSDFTSAGSGGKSLLGSRQRQSSSGAAAGVVPPDYGNGGTGAKNFQNQSAKAGGDGSDGLAIVEVYSGFFPGANLLCMKTKLIPLTIIGILSGDTLGVGS